MAAHLWTGAPPPLEYVTLVLCRDVYHCTPSQLRQERVVDVLPHLAVLQVEAQVIRAQSARPDRRGRGAIMEADDG